MELLADTRRLVHRLQPEYCIFAGCGNLRPGKLQVVTLVHGYLAARASLLEITEQPAAAEAAGLEGLLHGLEGQLHALLLIEPRTGASLMVVDVRNSRRRSQVSRPRFWI